MNFKQWLAMEAAPMPMQGMQQANQNPQAANAQTKIKQILVKGEPNTSQQLQQAVNDPNVDIDTAAQVNKAMQPNPLMKKMKK